MISGRKENRISWDNCLQGQRPAPVAIHASGMKAELMVSREVHEDLGSEERTGGAALVGG